MPDISRELESKLRKTIGPLADAFTHASASRITSLLEQALRLYEAREGFKGDAATATQEGNFLSSELEQFREKYPSVSRPKEARKERPTIEPPKLA